MVHTPLTNRLDTESSLYLRQHADNPVNWQPWDPQSRKTATAEDKPIFLSVGYAACHWCHVMEEESFADTETAEILNESFVPIKVDREAHPALDFLYQRVAQTQVRSGGWPLSVWMTPDGRPFGIGTYYPPTERYGRSAFQTVLEEYAQEWQTSRDTVEQRADRWEKTLRVQFRPPDQKPVPDSPLEAVAAEVHTKADSDHGGWGNRTKFPQVERIRLLLDSSKRRHRETALHTLDAMAAGGIYDHLGGGFHRYATDKTWSVPHFEKMLYDNAELAEVYVRAHMKTGDDKYRYVAEETIEFVRSVLGDEQGGFASTVDARSKLPDSRPPEAETEGAYYTWTLEELKSALDDQHVELVSQRFGITDQGDVDGTNVLSIARSVETLAEEFDMEKTDVQAVLDKLTDQLAEYRSRRPQPRIDRKIITAWNGLMVRTLARAGEQFDTQTYLDTAENTWRRLVPSSLDQPISRCRIGDDHFGAETLADYAFLGDGIATYAAVTDSTEAWKRADRIAQQMIDRFWVADDQLFYMTPAERTDLVIRPFEYADRAQPSSVAIAIALCQQLADYFPERNYDQISRQALSSVGARLDKQPLQHTSLARIASGWT